MKHNIDDSEVLFVEYKACNDGYNSRDAIVSAELAILIAVFTGLVVSMVYVTDKITQMEIPLADNTYSDICLFIFYIIIFLFGLISILGVSIDMQSTHSCKVSIRNRIIEIENEINNKRGLYNKNTKSLQLWSDSIEKRKTRYLLEKMFKFETHKGREKEINFLTLTVYSLILFWIILVLIFINIFCHSVAFHILKILIILFLSLSIFPFTDLLTYLFDSVRNYVVSLR